MSRWIFMFLPRSLCEDVISRLGSHVSSSRESPPPVPPPSSAGYTGHMSTPSLPPPPLSHLYYLFFSFFLCIGRITPEPFFNQLLLSVNNFISWDMGYSLQHYLYYVIAFHYLLAQNHMAHDSGSCASIRDQTSLSWIECGSKQEIFSFFF